MTAIAKYLTQDLTLWQPQRMTALNLDSGVWRVLLESGETITAQSVILTPPVPQSLDLLAAGNLALTPELLTELKRIEYEPCFAVMAVLDQSSQIPDPGYLSFSEGPIAWLADNQKKGVSAIPAVTIHASADFSETHWDNDRTAIAQQLLQAAEPWIGSAIQDVQIHGWRYSKPRVIAGQPYLLLNASPPLFIAGDAFQGPRVEGAVLSGWAVAEALMSH